MKKAKGHNICSWKTELEGHKNNEEMIGWLQILIKILFNEMASKIQFSALRA